MKNVVFWDVSLCRSCVNWRFGGKYRLHVQGRKIRERGTGFSSCCKLILSNYSTLKMEVVLSSETSVEAQSTQRHIPEDDILQNEVSLGVSERDVIRPARIRSVKIWSILSDVYNFRFPMATNLTIPCRIMSVCWTSLAPRMFTVPSIMPICPSVIKLILGWQNFLK
jgi:hypothetical protein